LTGGIAMRILWIGGSHARHLYYINGISAHFTIAGGILELREPMVPRPPEGISEKDRENFILHFKNRDLAEKKYFGSQPFPEINLLKISNDELNSKKTVDFVNEIDPELVLIFGTGLIKDPLFSALPEEKINLHLGLSPRYRGAATLFWPFYFLEPTYAGTTFHYIVSEPDAGEIIHQTTPELEHGDGIHDVACKAVIQSTTDAIELLKIYAEEKRWKRHHQRSTGKNFLNSDFKPEHLRVIYDIYDDDIVDKVLDGTLKSKEPLLFRQF
jgi:folate-dependent phosphoribosylglycinamide formyltransferase PurN